MRRGAPQLPPMVMRAPMPSAPASPLMNSPQLGRVVPMARANPAAALSTLITNQWVSVIRGEAVEATHWTIVVPPISVATAQGMPRPAMISSGSLDARLTFGAGGVTQQCRFGWPVNGTAFALMASTFELSVKPMDGVTTYSADNVPVASAFAVPGASPTAHQPLMDMPVGNYLGFTQQQIPAFARALHVYASDAAWTSTTVAWRDSAGATIANLRFTAPDERNVRIPIPTCVTSNNGLMEALVVVAGGGTGFCLAWELAFT
jgi:hypothetical protein